MARHGKSSHNGATGILSGKDTTSHKTARGIKKTSLSDLSKSLPTAEEIQNYQGLLAKESDRGAAVMVGAYVESALWFAINCSIPDPDPAIRKDWFEGANPPFGTFAAKIALGRVLAIYGSGMGDRLIAVKNIRNQFAHAPRPISFDTPAVEEACTKLVPEGENYTAVKGRKAYVAGCLAIAQVLQRYGISRGGKEIRVHFP